MCKLTNTLKKASVHKRLFIFACRTYYNNTSDSMYTKFLRTNSDTSSGALQSFCSRGIHILHASRNTGFNVYSASYMGRDGKYYHIKLLIIVTCRQYYSKLLIPHLIFLRSCDIATAPLDILILIYIPVEPWPM